MVSIYTQNKFQIWVREGKLIKVSILAVTLSLSDENFGKLVTGKTKAQSLFMSGKLKIKGNVMKGKKRQKL